LTNGPDGWGQNPMGPPEQPPGMRPPSAGGTSPPACGHGGITPGYQGSPAQGQCNPYNPSWGSVPPEPLGPSRRTLIIGAVLCAGVLFVAGVVAAVVPAGADPACPPSGCSHGNAHSPSYQDGYKGEHDYFSTPQNHAYLANEMKQGYTAGLACQVEVGGGAPPANLADWLAGCTDALHDLGFKP
jgi:hypothetical protein